MASMASCQDVYTFLNQVSGRNVTVTLAPADLSSLQQLNIVQVVGADQYAQLVQSVQSLYTDEENLQQKKEARAELAAQIQTDTERTHSVLFHLEGKDKQAAEVQQESQDAATLQADDAELASDQKAYDENMGRKALLDSLTPYGGGYVGLTSLGAVSLRDLGARLYRVSDLAFPSYLAQSQQVDGELNDIANTSSQYFAALAAPLAPSDVSYLWAISIGLAKRESNVPAGATTFLSAYTGLAPLAHNPENRLMAAEIVAGGPRAINDVFPILKQLDKAVRDRGVPKESSLGVASILLLGERADGTFATDNLQTYLLQTASPEAAALLAIVNRPLGDLEGKFTAIRNMFGGWGYAPSEDVELSSAYLAVSDLPMDGLGPKLSILTKGLGTYLEYPLVAAAILASIPVLEANETLRLMEEAYDILGKRTPPMSQQELICLAVRMIHGIRSETVSKLDATATQVPAPPVDFHYAPGMWFFYGPVFIGHGAYFSTFSTFEGAHPAHAHGMGGGFGGGFGGGGGG